MTTSLSRPAREAGSGLRPLDPTRDFGQVAHVIEIAFATEMRPGSELVLRDLRWMDRLRWLFRLASPLMPLWMDGLSGFVWQQDHRIVGNITVSRSNQSGSRWMISNVAVLPEARRQGIACELMRAAMDYARENGAEWVTLHVRSDNQPALALYKRLGFHFVDAHTDLFAPMVRASDQPVSAGSAVHPAVASRWYEAYDLARATATAAAQAIRPLLPSHYRFPDLSFGDRLRQGLGLPIRQRLWGEIEGQLVALLTIDEQNSGRFGALVDVIEHPRARGRIESALANEIGQRLRGRRDVRAKVPTELTELRAALTGIGFHETFSLDQMAIQMER